MFNDLLCSTNVQDISLHEQIKLKFLFAILLFD